VKIKKKRKKKEKEVLNYIYPRKKASQETHIWQFGKSKSNELSLTELSVTFFAKPLASPFPSSGRL
jgi:hypothetical protein